MRAAVPSFDLLPAGPGKRRFEWRRRLPVLGLALCAGLTASLLSLNETRDQAERMHTENFRAQLDLERMQAQHRDLELQLQAKQQREARWQQHLLQQGRWLAAHQTLVALAHPLGPVAGSQLLELRLDEQNLHLVGQIGPQQMHGWLRKLGDRAHALGPLQIVEIGPGSVAKSGPLSDSRTDSRTDLPYPTPGGGGPVLRFVVRTERGLDGAAGSSP